MDSLERLKQALVAQVNARVPVQTVWAECVSANAEEGTMTASREGLEYDDVLLGLGPDITVPAPGSKVLLGLVENQRAATFLLFAESIQERRINGSAYGGIVKADSLAQEINALRQDLNSLKQAFASWVPVGGPTSDGGAGLKALAASWSAQQLTPVASASLQNTKVKHG